MKIYSLIIIGILGCQSNLAWEELESSHWYADIDYFQKCIEKRHANPYNFISRDSLKWKMERFKQNSDKYNLKQMLLEMEKIGALIGDGHTWITKRFESDPYLLFTVYLKWFDEDGLRVIGINNTNMTYLGWKVLRINEVPLEKVFEKTDTYIPQNENRYYTQYWRDYWCRNADALFHEGIISNSSETEFTLISDKGEIQKINLKAEIADFSNQKLVFSYQPVPFFMSNPNKKIWYQSINDQLYYIKVNGYPDERETKQILIDIISELSKKMYTKIVFDFRINGGGNKKRVEDIIDEIYKKYPATRYYGISGDHSFSAAMANLVYLRDKANALLLGEPPTNRPNFYAENHFAELPYSKIPISVATKYLRLQSENNTELKLDTYIMRNFNEYNKGKDAALKWVIDQ